MHSELTSVAIVITIALLGGLLLRRFSLPPIVGYIGAGILLGPSMFSLIEDRATVNLLAELGVLLLLFSLGLEMSLRLFKRLWGLALGITGLQFAGSLLVMTLCGQLFQWSMPVVFFFTCVFALSSTAVAVKILESVNELNSTTGRITISILIAQDLALIPMILFLRHIEEGIWNNPVLWIKVVLSMGGLVALFMTLNKRPKLSLPYMDKLQDLGEDMFPVAILALCFMAAAISGLLGLSAAYGAFLAGLILGNSQLRSLIGPAVHPIQSILLMVFFLSIGLLLDIGFLFSNFFQVLLLLFFILLGKTIFNVIFLHWLKQPWPRAFLAGTALSQLGEFSFLLTTIGVESGVVGAYHQNLVIAVTVLSLILSPFWFEFARHIHSHAPKTIDDLKNLFQDVYGERWAAIKGWGKMGSGLLKKLFSSKAPEPAPQPILETTPERDTPHASPDVASDDKA